jgi:hypothetical protein
LSKTTYIAGTFYTIWGYTFAAADANSSAIRAIFICDFSLNSTASAPPRGLTYIFDHNQEKSNLFTLRVNWKFSWDRDFV